MKYVKELFVIAMISALVGGLVSLPVMILLGRPLFELLEGAGVGALIGLAARLAFQFFYHNLGGNNVIGFIAIAFVIAAGTLMGAFSLGIRQVVHFCVLVSLAEITGMTMAFLGYRRYRKMNAKLKAIQAGYDRPENGPPADSQEGGLDHPSDL